jgi:hypothetical protein
MPSDWLQVPHHKQSQDGRCLPACARMVLAHLGQLVGLSSDTAYVNDPAFDSAPHPIPLDRFLLAWSEFDYEYAVITLV